MLYHIGLFVVGILVGVILTVSLCFPKVGRALGKTAAVVLLALGGGLTTWGLIGALGPASFEPMEMGPILFSTPAQTLGFGVGSLSGGVAALVMAFVGRRSSR